MDEKKINTGMQSLEDFTYGLMQNKELSGTQFFAARDEHKEKFLSWQSKNLDSVI